MVDLPTRAAFETLVVQHGGRDFARDLAASVRGGGEGKAALAALFVQAAVAAPERLADIYDGAAEGWRGAAPAVPAISVKADPASIDAGFWPDFWALADDPEVGRDAGEITARTAALAGTLPESFRVRVAHTALSYPGVGAAAAVGYPAPFTLAALARCPTGSLGAEFHHLIVDNGFDLEVLDREALGLADLPAPLDYLNARILQCHDLWHILAGYQTTVLHEVAISGFQMGQFGHHYSAMFLAVVTSKIALNQPDALPLFLDVILSAWTHGRESPPLLGLDWPTLWDLPTESIRSLIGITPYTSPYPADMFEQMRAA